MPPIKPILAGLALIADVSAAHSQNDAQPAPAPTGAGEMSRQGAGIAPQGRPRRREARFDAEREAAGGAALSAAVAGQGCEQQLVEALASVLDCGEQRQAAEATERAIAGPPGTAATWASERRPNVSGSSTVIAVEAASGGRCLVVADVVTIDGAERRAPRRMCGVPPLTR